MEYRGYNIVSDPDLPTMSRVEAIGRGSVHLSLRGFYTTAKSARDAIDSYETRKEEENGKTSSGRGNQQVHRRIKYRREPANLSS